jgi:DNA invertase Pin-like site-specific DNA recombinase
MAHMLATFSQWERRLISERAKAGWLRSDSGCETGSAARD